MNRPTILLAGVSLRLRARVQGRLKEVAVESVPDPKEMLERLRQQKFSLVVLDQSLDPGHRTVDHLREVHHGQIIYCCSGGIPTSGYLRHLVHALGVARVLAHPVDPDELCRQAALVLGIRLPVQATGADQDPRVARLLEEVWKKSEATYRERSERLKRAAEALARGGLEGEARREAERDAHILAGSLGTFGLHAATLMARDLEEIFHQPGGDTGTRAVQLAERLSGELVRPEPALPAPPAGTPVWLLVADEPERLGLGQLESKVASEASEVRVALAGPCRGAVVEVPAEPARANERLALIQEMTARAPHLPVVALLPEDTQDLRVRASFHGARVVLVAPVSPEELQASLQGLLADPSGERRILAVDDDPVVLGLLEAVLSPHHYELELLSDPLLFWDALEQHPPDLLILDVDMPHVTGLELCRAVRSDPRFSGLPVLFLSSYNDSGTVQRIFQAGADDFVAKPVLGPELVTRVANRLSRTRQVRKLSAGGCAGPPSGSPAPGKD